MIKPTLAAPDDHAAPNDVAAPDDVAGTEAAASGLPRRITAKP